MSKRNLFDNKNKVLADKTQTDIGSLAESSGNVQQRLVEKGRFIPVVNFEYPQNFARYGKAEKYYTDSFSRIYNDYPYDGSLKERNDFRNKSSYIDLYILDNKYPRSTGYSIFSPNGWGTIDDTFLIPPSTVVNKPSNLEYVQVVGGPHEAPSEYISGSLQKQFEYANVYDPLANRTSNLKCNFDDGVTIEFWMLKPSGSMMTGSTDLEIPAMLSNGVTGSVTIGLFTSGAADPLAQRILFAANDDTTLVAYGGGGSAIPLSSDQMFDGRWHHYAFSVQNSASFVKQKVYFDGTLIGENITAATLSEVTGALKLNVGAAREGTITAGIRFPSDGFGKLSGSIDEFRYWKTARTPDQIGKYWFTQYGGGTNLDDSNVDLGVYLKFNEGITGRTAVDSTVLDYSGRISNGIWTGYTAAGRSTGSAIDEHLEKVSEFKDPIIYSFNPRVIAALEPLQASGSNYDLTNNSSIYNSIPSWITEEDEIGSGDLLNLTQIMSSYLDTLHLQIEALPRLKDKIYNDPTIIKPKPFSSRLLESQGFIAPEIFANADVLSQILNRDTTQKFELELTDIKNTIYQNVYNNLVHIYKLKGTDSAFRNLIRCFGADERIIRTNIYGNNVEYELKDNYENTTFKKRYADFNNPDRFYATVYQQTQSGNPNSVSYISGSTTSDISKEGYTSFTLESEVIFPKKRDIDDLNYFDTPFLTSSLFGFHSAEDDSTDFTWPVSDWNLQVYAYREENESKNVQFALSSSTSVSTAVPFELVSDLYHDVYDNEKWNFAVRVTPTKAFAGTVSGAVDPSYEYDIEFYGVSSDAGVIINEFLLTTSSVPSDNVGYLSAPKRIYAGAYRENFTGSILERSDVKISSVRYWASYLNDDVIKIHARDPSNYGSSAPYESTYPWVEDLDQAVPQVATLAMDWNFANVTASDAGISGTPGVSDAGYTVSDFSSGSIDQVSRYGYFSAITNLQHTGRGDFYLPNDTKVVDVKYVYSGKQVAPEVIQASDAISALGESDIYFTRESRPVTFTYMIEKSMYQTISDEMLNIFSTIVDFNNLIGEPVNRYRQKYKNMEKLRQLFFEKVENTPDLDRYVDFYKWIDSSLSTMLEQLVPMSADISDDVRTMVESHILERNKYQTKFPTLESAGSDPETGIRGINESLYNWKYGHAPVGGTPQNESCFWWKERAERYTPLLSSSVVGVNSDKTQILSASTQVLNRSYSTPYRLSVDKSPAIHGGTNYNQNKKIDFVKASTKFGSSTGVTIEDVQTPKDCTDVYNPLAKTKLAFKATTNDTSYYSGNGKIFAPFSLYSSSIDNDVVAGSRITNLHSDTYGNDNDTSLQSPFTEFAVGGLQYRHVAPLSATTVQERPEGWKFEGNKFTFPDTANPRATYYREPMAKRPVNIKNIKINSLGNYSKDYEIVQTSGRYVNNLAFVQSGGFDIGPIGNPILNNAVKSQYALSMSRSEDESLLFPDPTWNSGGADQLGGVNDPNGGWSFSGWFKPITTTNSFNYLFESDNPSAGFRAGVAILYEASAEGGMAISEQWTDAPSSNRIQFTSSNGIVNYDVWNHIVFSHKTSNTSSTSTAPFLLLNGVEEPLSDNVAFGPPLGIFKPPRTGEASRFARDADSVNAIDATIDEFALWNRALSREEAQYIYGEGRFAQDLFQRGIDNKLIGWWRMGDTEGDTDGPSGIILDVLDKNNATASSTATGPTFVTSPLLGGRYKSNTSKISRGSHPSIFINRFAAPGGPETDGDSDGGPGLDRYSGEYSAYNSMNWRNPLTRKALRPLLSSHANQFGYFSSGGFSPGTILSRDYLAVYPGPYAAGFYDAFPVDSQIASSSVNSLDYSGTPNFHKVHRNIRRRMESGSIFTGSRFDNAWVTHPIPQSDLQYAWINDSYTSVDPSGLGYWYSDQFEFTTREAVVLQDSFTSSLNLTNWTSQSVTMRQSDDSDNWIARMGTLIGTGSDPRLLTTANDYKLPFRVDYSYARGSFQNPASRLYLEFDGLSNLSGTAAAVSSSEGKSSISFWLKADERCFTDPPTTRNLFIFDKFARKTITLIGAPDAGMKYEREYTAGANDKVSEIAFYDGAALQFPSSSLIDGFVHFCIVDDETDPEYETKMYANGVNYARQIFTASGDPEPIEDEFIIGNTVSISTFSFTGSMDSISWFNRLLTETEVQELYNNGTPGNVANVSFWPTEITASNQVHYWQLGDASPDEILLGTPPATDASSAYDWGKIPTAYEENLYAYGTGDMRFLEYPGYNMAPPQPIENDETMSLELSTDAGVTWQTASILDDDGDFAGNTVGFIGRSYTFRESTPGQTGRIRFRQNNYGNPKRDNWAVNDVTISQISYVDPVTFSPYSDFVSITTPGGRLLGYPAAEVGALSSEFYIPTVYNGLNYNVYEPINAGTQFLGYENAIAPDYANTVLFNAPYIFPEASYPAASASMLNAILLKRNGPYGYPMFKQTRTAEHALARYYRNNNIITVTQEPGTTVVLNGTQYVPPFGNTRQYQEPAVSSKYQDLEYKLGMRVTTYPKDKPAHYVIRPVTMKLSYGNNLSYFNSTQLNRRAKYDKIDPSEENQTYDVIKDLYLDGELNSLESPVYSFISLKYREWVYPKGKNTYIGENRTRTDYTETFWRDSRFDRDTLGTTKKFGGLNSQGVAVISQSAWALDGRNEPSDTGADSLNYPSNSAGELQNDYTLAWNASIFDFPSSIPAKFTIESLHPAPLYNRKNDPMSLYGVVSANGNEFINTNITSSDFVNASEFSGTNRGYQVEVGNVSSSGGDAQWQAGELAGRVENSAFVSASSRPFYDDYDLWREEIRLKNKEYSIVPEFRISEHMEFYVNREGATVSEESLRDSFLEENQNFLSIFGTTISSSVDDFFETYSYGDFMKYFEIIDADHKQMSSLEKTLKLKCKAIKKFIAYDGFYPSERCLQIAQEFSRSYGPYVTSSGDYDWDVTDQKMRPLLEPFLSPGILFNTIKSGMACDYPIHTSSFDHVQYYMSGGADLGADEGVFLTKYYAIGTSSANGANGWDYRVPFEAILAPETVNGIPLPDMEVNPQYKFTGSLSGTGSVSLTASLAAPSSDNLYKFGISNFLAESVQFFLKGGKMTRFVSDTSDSGYSFDSGSYGMRLRLRRSMNRDRTKPEDLDFIPANDDYEQTDLYETMTMYSRPSAFGPPVAATNVIFPTGSDPSIASAFAKVGSGDWTQRQQNADSLFGRNPSFTPPYYDGECWLDIVYTAPTEGITLTLDELFQSASVIQTRIQQNRKSWNSINPLDPSTELLDSDLTGSYPMFKDNANKFSMKLRDCVNVFNKRFVQSTEDPTKFSPQWVIELKMETPMLNFGDKTIRPLYWKSGSNGGNVNIPDSFGRTATPIGMWHQFGTIPREDEGIFLSIEPIDQDYLSSRSPTSTAYPGAATGDFKSMVDIVGFTPNDSRKLGSIRSSKTLYEAVVAVPYIIQDGERKFIRINKSLINRALKEIEEPGSTKTPPGDSIIDMVSKMKKYILPPRMDFITNPDFVKPYAMYIFEFSHTFDKNDLSYMWQNTAPKLGTSFEESTAELSHKLINREILKQYKNQLKWMVFKVKQRGNNNYYSKVTGQFQSQDKLDKLQKPYSYNWPYDYCSIVEFVKMQSEIKYSSDEAVDVTDSFADVNEELKTGIRATVGLPPTPDQIVAAEGGGSENPFETATDMRVKSMNVENFNTGVEEEE